MVNIADVVDLSIYVKRDIRCWSNNGCLITLTMSARDGYSIQISYNNCTPALCYVIVLVYVLALLMVVVSSLHAATAISR